MPARILVTGASGTIGGALVRRLLPAHRDGRLVVVAGARNAARRERLAALGVEVAAIDYDDVASVRAAVAGVESMFLATGYSVDMLVHSKTVLDAALAAGARHVVHLGASGSDTLPYAHLVWHAYVERYIEALGFSWTHLRPKTFMRNLLAVVRPGSTVLRQFFGDARLGWIDPEDIAAVAAVALESPAAHRNTAYHLSAEALTMAEVAATIARVTGLPFTYEARDPADLPGVLTKAGMEPLYAAALARSIAAAARGEVAGLADVTDAVERVTGRPATRWADFAARHRERFLAAGTQPSPRQPGA